jgi:hypothetical protein
MRVLRAFAALLAVFVATFALAEKPQPVDVMNQPLSVTVTNPTPAAPSEVKVNNPPSSPVPVTGSVVVTGAPPVTGTVEVVATTPVPVSGNVGVTGSVAVTSAPPVTGTVNIGSMPSVTVANPTTIPNPLPVTGTLAVNEGRTPYTVTLGCVDHAANKCYSTAEIPTGKFFVVEFVTGEIQGNALTKGVAYIQRFTNNDVVIKDPSNMLIFQSSCYFQGSPVYEGVVEVSASGKCIVSTAAMFGAFAIGTTSPYVSAVLSFMGFLVDAP